MFISYVRHDFITVSLTKNRAAVFRKYITYSYL